MRAAVVPALGAPLEIREMDTPRPGPGQVLVKIEASGLCHTDIHAARGDWPVKPRMLRPPDMRSSRRGRASSRSRSATGLPWLGHACGTCGYCVAGRETYCPTPQYKGYTMDGGYAEFTMRAAHAALNPKGRLVLVGLPADNCWSFRSSRPCSRASP
jgi:alcohol dehydrogenase, propanol-preferring